jgi:xanthine dehydrogenase accessory factor
MERQEINDILEGLREARANGEGAALASIVRVRGSAYRREGARMLIREDGSHVCMLSGGCLEPEVVMGAKFVIEDRKPSLTGYDLTEDITWGLGIGCGGSVDIYVEPVLEEDELLTAWLGLLERAELGVLATVLPATVTGVPSDGLGRFLIREDGSTLGDLESELQPKILEAAREMMRSLYPRAETKRFKRADGSSVDVFLDASAPAPELVIFGAGHDAIPLSDRAVDLGWIVKVVDSRARFLHPERFPGANLITAEPSDLESHISLGPRSFVMVMNHHLERDRICLRFALESATPYIGVLGPRKRFLEALEDLQKSGFEPDATQLEKVRNPVGLDIGAESPSEVALSIMSELIAVRRGFAGGILNGRAGRIHDPLVPASSQKIGPSKIS